MRDAEQMTDDEKLATLFGVGGASAMPWKLGMEYQPRFRPYPSALAAWYFSMLTLIFFPAALVAVPLAVRAGRRGNRYAWLAAGLAIVAVVANLTMIATIL